MTKQHYYAILVSTLLMFGVSTMAVAQGQSQPKNTQQQSAQQQKQPMNSGQNGGKKAANGGQSMANKKQSGQSGQFITAQKSSQVLASSIIGMTIQNGTGKKAKSIGTVNDLIMNKQHQLTGIVVGIGGFLGIGQKSVGMPWDQVKNINPKKGIAVVKVTKKQLQNAPAFVSKKEQRQKKKQQQMKQKQQQSQ